MQRSDQSFGKRTGWATYVLSPLRGRLLPEQVLHRPRACSAAAPINQVRPRATDFDIKVALGIEIEDRPSPRHIARCPVDLHGGIPGQPGGPGVRGPSKWRWTRHSRGRTCNLLAVGPCCGWPAEGNQRRTMGWRVYDRYLLQRQGRSGHRDRRPGGALAEERPARQQFGCPRTAADAGIVLQRNCQSVGPGWSGLGRSERSRIDATHDVGAEMRQATRHQPAF